MKIVANKRRITTSSDFSAEETMYYQALIDYGYDPKDAELVISSGDYVIFEDCEDMSDVAYQFLETYYPDVMSDLPEIIRVSIDYGSAGDYLDTSSEFIPCGTGYIEVLHC